MAAKSACASSQMLQGHVLDFSMPKTSKRAKAQARKSVQPKQSATCRSCLEARSFLDQRLHKLVKLSCRPERFRQQERGHIRASQTDGSDTSKAPAFNRRAALVAAAAAATFWEATISARLAHSANLVDPTLDVVKQEIKKVVTLAKAPGVLRLVFHDGFTYNSATKTGGPNGSVVYELDRPENEGLKRALRPLEKVKATLGENVSWADLIAVAGAEAVAMTGGPVIPVRLGRRDQGKADPEDQMPPETLDAVTLKSFFKGRDYSVQEMIALSGAHTLGGKGFGDPTTFDNSYYKILLDKPWLTDTAMTRMIGLKTDRALPEDDECRKWVEVYANDQGRFFQDFASAYDKLVTQGVTWS